MSNSPSIFISYRREDSEDIAGRIYDRLKDHFGAESVFFDIDTIPLGIDFEEYIDKSVSQCHVFVAIIGKSWLTVADDDGNRRLDLEGDFVRLEIESALTRKIPVIPLLVRRAVMPPKSKLPESIRKLASRHGAQVRSGNDFHNDVDRLIAGIEAHSQTSASVSSTSSTPTPSSSPPSPVAVFPPSPSKGKLERFNFEVVTVDARGQERDRRSESGDHFLEELGDGVSLDMVCIPGGEFLMGSPEDAPERLGNEGPQHRVMVPEFFMGRYLVTQKQWRGVAGLEPVKRPLKSTPSHFKGDNRPVECVSWEAAAEFCDRISVLTGHHYRLPSESQWEYACRAGTTTSFHFGPTFSSEMANYGAKSTSGDGPAGKYRGQTTDVGQFPANGFGLHDMHGNVWEWCQDHWHSNYDGAPNDGSVWLGDTTDHVLRGGSWANPPMNYRSARRINYDPRTFFRIIGFRVACASPSSL